MMRRICLSGARMKPTDAGRHRSIRKNLDTKRMGDLALTDHEVDALVAFMEALSDG